MKLEVFPSTDRERMAEAIALRIAVFVHEQRVPEEEEIDAHDGPEACSLHVLVRLASGDIVATGRFYDAGDRVAQIGRMAVRAENRGSGLGRRVLERLIHEAREGGFERAVLFAQLHAVRFYAKSGFTAFGETLLDGGIVHQPMERALSARERTASYA